jgi:hypothetical protein
LDAEHYSVAHFVDNLRGILFFRHKEHNDGDQEGKRHAHDCGIPERDEPPCTLNLNKWMA